MKILDRYIVREMAGPFLFGLGAFTILFFSVESLMGVARMVIDADAGFATILKYLLNRLPSILVFVFPMAILLGSLLAFGRLSSDSELTALKASGIGFLRIAAPGLAFCLVVTLVSVWLNETIVPPTMKKAYDILIATQDQDTFQRALLTAPRVLENGMEQMTYAHKLYVDQKSMDGVFIHYFFENMRRREIYAARARWDAEREVWFLENMRTVEYDRSQDPLYEVIAEKGWTALSPEESPPSPDKLAQRQLRPEELNRRELSAQIARMESFVGRDKGAFRERNRYSVMLHQKLAIPFASFIFGTFAIPLGVRPHRSSRSVGLGFSLLFILIYYVLMTVGMVLGETGALTPAVAAWLPNLVFGSAGVILLLEASRR